jgi:hypothetical protein
MLLPLGVDWAGVGNITRRTNTTLYYYYCTALYFVSALNWTFSPMSRIKVVEMGDRQCISCVETSCV